MIGVRAIAACLTLAVILTGPLSPMALAQQTVPAPAPVAAPPPPPPPPPDRPSYGTDVYDVAAPVVTVIKAPLNVATCSVGTAVAIALFALTFGSAYKAATRTVEQGCRGPWLITGEDLRPEPPRSEVPIGANP